MVRVVARGIEKILPDVSMKLFYLWDRDAAAIYFL